MMTMERRTSPRATVSLVGALNSGEREAPVVVLDLSLTGARIQTADPPDSRGEYLLHFSVHRIHYRASFRVVHWTQTDGTYSWGGLLVGLSDQQLAELRLAVDAAAGLSAIVVRPWAEILEEAFRWRDEQIVVGATPAGREIRLSGADCLAIGAAGVELFVTTVGGLETA